MKLVKKGRLQILYEKPKKVVVKAEKPWVYIKPISKKHSLYQTIFSDWPIGIADKLIKKHVK